MEKRSGIKTVSSVLRSENTLALPVSKHSGIVCACMKGLEEATKCSSDDLWYAVLPTRDEGMSYLRFATQIYSKLVVLGKPCLDVVILRRGAHELPEIGVNSTVISGSCPRASSLDYGGNLVPVGAAGYKFGDGSADFYDKYSVVAVGGTFDRLHAGHRLLLTAAAWASRDTLWIGISSDVLLQHKKHKELIASHEERCISAKNFARKVKPSLPNILISKLTDPAGPSATDPSIQAIVVSSETASGARRINQARVNCGLNRMVIIEVDVLDTQGHKLSSSALREHEEKS